MKKSIAAALLTVLLLTGCSPKAQPVKRETLHILATTYPVYLFTTALTERAPGVEVRLLVNSQTSCLHNYTLTVADMKAIEGADVIVMNGVGLEEFMEDALSHSEAAVIDASESGMLLPSLDEDEGEYDPHIWMDPRRADMMIATIAQGLSDLDPSHKDTYSMNRTLAYDALGGMVQDADMAQLMIAKATGGKLSLSDVLTCDKLITFHDGFQYFAQAFGFDLLKAIEEEDGATASAQEIKEIVELIGEYDIPAIFTERNGSTATAEAIAAETGCKVYELDMIMSGDGVGIQPYIDAMNYNLSTILEALR